MKAAVIAFSQKGCIQGERVVSYFAQNGGAAALARCKEGELSLWTKEHFGHDALVFIGSCGIAVRAVAPFLKSKSSDPAVIVIDERAVHVVSLLSGHIGGANDLTVRLARFLGARPVITTATDVHGIFAIDAWAAKNGLKTENPEKIKRISARLLAGETINIQCDFPVEGRLPKGLALCEKGGDVLITHRALGCEKALRLIVPVLTLGIGCKKGTGAKTIESVFGRMLKKSNCHPLAVIRVCSIDLKSQEPGILDFCRSCALPFQTFSHKELAGVPGSFTASAFVNRVTGVAQCCERSAVLGSGGGRLLAGKTAENGVTMALAVSPYTIIFDKADET
jgi:cobalt-precorrin 5A hydrolase